MNVNYTDLPLTAQRVLRNLVRVVKRARSAAMDRALDTGEVDLYTDLDSSLGMAGILMPDGTTLDDFLREGACPTTGTVDPLSAVSGR